ncbi:MAG: hypothetical protein JW725_03615 [Candidatus Babeliaceae bacterium]|nr:hypothetical protein [Candidatus Babeliaceae bacterium]
MDFINPEQLKEPVEIEKAIDEPVLLYCNLGDGELQTFSLRIIRSQESSYSAPYYLLTIESRKGSSSSSKNGGKVKPGGIWVADTSINALLLPMKAGQYNYKSKVLVMNISFSLLLRSRIKWPGPARKC